ncbi:MAG: thiamine pyrophosphate-dependent enzyme, partial [Acidimicrobiales bacterium]
ILDRHGRDAVYIASTGYISRAVYEIAGDDYCVFYMQGSMGLAPAIGLGLSLRTDREVVVINGDASLLMCLGATHTLRDHAPSTLFHYVLDNGSHESVGGQPAAHLETRYPGVTDIFKISRDGKPARVAVAPADNAHAVRAFADRARSGRSPG